MNPTTNERGPIQLPTPISPENMPGAVTAPLESAPGQAETFPSPTGVALAIPAVPLPVPSAPLPTAAVNSVGGSASSSTTPAVADDVDLIEKEWVQKAKAIISQTQSDPHQQSRELTIFKADYMQKRYNKVLKLSE